MMQKGKTVQILQSSEVISETDEQLSEALRRNRATYDRLSSAYESTGHARLRQAHRWLKPVLRHLKSATAPLSVLELGSADGFLAGYLSDLGHDVTALEYSREMAAATRRQAPGANILEQEFLSCDLGQQFDVILCSAFVHLLPQPWDTVALAKVSSLLKPKGLAYLATTLHSTTSAGYEEKGSGLRRYRMRHTQESFESLIAAAGMSTTRFYVAADRLSPSSKLWGNWITQRGVQ
jgi:SAM-dependent methyltransferase